MMQRVSNDEIVVRIVCNSGKVMEILVISVKSKDKCGRMPLNKAVNVALERDRVRKNGKVR
jgi:hypothetical protein